MVMKKRQTLRLSLLLAASSIVGCSSSKGSVEKRTTIGSRQAADGSGAPVSSPEQQAPPRTKTDTTAAPPQPRKPFSFSPVQAARILFLDPKDRKVAQGQHQKADTLSRRALLSCPFDDVQKQIRCLIEQRYKDDAKALSLALGIYDDTGSIAGLLPSQRMEGGWRGKLQLVPCLPIRGHRKHLAWIKDAMKEIDSFFLALGRHGTPDYRWRAMAFRFFRSSPRPTPSAMAWGWNIAYNVKGSLFRKRSGVVETLFHEIFHLNDAAHKDFSHKALLSTYNSIISRCRKKTKLSDGCLRPFAPHSTKVMGRVYYAFHPEGGVAEYAAEISVRYFLEQRAVIGKLKGPAPFKCGPPENGLAWSKMVKEFFGGVDLVPACPAHP